MRYMAGQERARGEGKYISAEWVPVSAEPPVEPPKPGSVVARLKARGAFEG